MRRLVGAPKAIGVPLAARTALLDLLGQDAAVIALFRDFTAVNESAVRVAVVADVSAASYSIAIDPFFQQTRQMVTPLRDRLEELVYDRWHLEWPWLVFELIDLHRRLLSAIAFGEAWQGTFEASIPPRITTLPDAPTPEAGESVKVYVQRVRAFYRRRKLDEPPLQSSPGGFQVDAMRIQRDVEWFYRTQIKQPPDSTPAVAKNFKNDRRTVLTGIERARKELTSVAPLGLRPPPHGTKTASGSRTES
jgi:hypothetical protein